MLIKGFQKTTLLDFPQKVAATIFTGGCNFRCPFCHNASLVTKISASEEFSESEILTYLNRRKGILDGVCITGGEPLLQSDIVPFIAKIKETGLLVKLDTNGSRPNMLKELLDRKLVDYIAMDIKNSKEKYATTCGLSEMPFDIERSIDIIMTSNITYEFRTTVVRELHTDNDISQIAKRISGAERYFLQGFIDSGDIIGNGFSAYTPLEMQTLLKTAQVYVPNARLRGIDL